MSEIPVPEKFLKPFYKFHLTQLKQAVRSGSEWSVTIKGGTSLPVFMVWVQGRVKKVNIAEDIIVLEEEGSEITVDTISASPGGCGWLETGQYLQVVGQLISVDRGGYFLHALVFRGMPALGPFLYPGLPALGPFLDQGLSPRYNK